MALLVWRGLPQSLYWRKTTYERWNISDAPVVPEDDGDVHYDTELFDDGPHIDGDGA